MGKLAGYILLMTGLTLIFYYAGLLEGTPSSLLLNLLSIDNLQSNPMYLEVKIAIAIVIGTAVAATFFNVLNMQTFAKGAIIVYIFSIGWDFLVVASKVMSANRPIGIMLFAPLLTLWLFVVYEYFNPSGL